MTVKPAVVADVLGVAGAGSVVAGVYINFGLGWALIVAGVLIAAAGLNIARLENNVIDETQAN